MDISVETVSTHRQHEMSVARESWIHRQDSNYLVLRKCFSINMVFDIALNIGDEHWLAELILHKRDIIEARDRNGYTLLHLAVEGGHEKMVQKLMDLKADVHAKYPSHARTALHLLAEFGKHPSSPEILKVLLTHGEVSNLLIGDVDGNTPLHLAVLKGNTEVLTDMLEFFPGISYESSSAQPTFDVNLLNKEGRTPLHLSAGLGNVEATRLLLGKKASKDAQDAYGAKPLHFAARSGNVKVLEVLWSKAEDDRVTKTNPRTALHYAAWNGHTEAVSWLLEHKASVNAKDAIEGDTPLHLASRKGRTEVVKVLISATHSKPELTNKKGELALGLADDGEHGNTAEAFITAMRESGRKNILRNSLWTKHVTNGTTWLHYFGAYGKEKDLAWILSEIQNQPGSGRQEEARVNTGDAFGRTVVHWAAMKGNIDGARVLAQTKAVNLNVKSPKYYHATPLAVALVNDEMAFAEELMQHSPKGLDVENWLHGLKLDLIQVQDADIKKKFDCLQHENKPHDTTILFSSVDLFSDMPLIYTAIFAGRHEIAHFIQKHSRGVQDGVNERAGKSGRMALHWATILRQCDMVTQLCKTDAVLAQALAANIEDEMGRTAVQYAKQLGYKDIENELMQRSDVSAYMEGMYKDRQVYVDASNAILVGAALIASVTFAGWLQPPLSYTPYYDLSPLQPPSPPNIFQSYAAIQQHMGVRCFWVCNSLSFSFAIATILAGLVGVVPIRCIYIANTVVHLRRWLVVAAAMLGLCILFVLAAFAAAGFAVLPPLFEYQAYMLATVVVGGMPCLLLWIKFACRLWSLRPAQYWLRLSKKANPHPHPNQPLYVPTIHAFTQLPTQPIHASYDYPALPWDDGLNFPRRDIIDSLPDDGISLIALFSLHK